jgi:uncharacterized membrane protein YdbT with pleckstrin-like domain
MDFGTDPAFQFRGIERWLLALLAVPSAPEPPEGSPDSIQVFHAGQNYYVWTLLMWAAAVAALFIALTAVSVVLLSVEGPRQAPAWARVLFALVLAIAWMAFIISAAATFVARRINFRLRWYIVTDRSLRIRSGIFSIRELTMTFGNIQEIRVTSGPLQHLLGLADLEVHAAGGGGEKQAGGHVARFEGLSNANAVRDVMTERLRHYRDSGLGDTPHRGTSAESSDATLGGATVEAAKAVLLEARALRSALSADAP